MTKMCYDRNPYPVPDLSGEGYWIQRGPVLGRKISPESKEWDLKLKPHERLFAHHTLNSIRKDRRLFRPNVPNDALDLALTSVYVHDKDTLVPKMYVTMQPEALGRETWRVLRNKIKIMPKKLKIPSEAAASPEMGFGEIFEAAFKEPPLGHKMKCYRGPVAKRRIHPSSVKLAIGGPHTDQTNPGYSRKIDGTFYNI